VVEVEAVMDVRLGFLRLPKVALDGAEVEGRGGSAAAAEEEAEEAEVEAVEVEEVEEEGLLLAEPSTQQTNSG
jgi:hypothetical protein